MNRKSAKIEDLLSVCEDAVKLTKRILDRNEDVCSQTKSNLMYLNTFASNVLKELTSHE